GGDAPGCTSLPLSEAALVDPPRAALAHFGPRAVSSKIVFSSMQLPREATLTKWGEFQGRVEDNRLVTGRGSYVGDVCFEGTAHAVLVRAQVASARVVSIDTAAALASPGVLGVYTARDLADDGLADFACGVDLARPDGPKAHQARRPGLVRNRIRCGGEAVAVGGGQTPQGGDDGSRARRRGDEGLSRRCHGGSGTRRRRTGGVGRGPR